ncbi:hypothetical protein Pan216_47080 [Planctomycetes bacterium Pan216]|uniref:Uncharacterized protein n=1 Tax=Kolteria novifilia TaxID=2527975 RepID=A0A518BA63_9BACT|nr:hypothetical protein Pan216_47080 [Planctomycetes bacterium Pan216]
MSDVYSASVLVADVTPLATSGKVLLSLAGVGAIVTALWLLRLRRRTAKSGDMVHHLWEAVPSSGWRPVIAILLAIDGLMAIVGVWIDPRQTPRAFVVFWSVIILLTGVVVCLAVLDILILRQQGLRAERDLAKTLDDRLRDELEEYRQAQAHRHNGSTPRQN